MNTPSDRRTENDAVLEFAQEHLDPEIIDLEHPGGELLVGKLALVPKGVEVQSVKKFLDEYRTAPERRVGAATLATEASFIDHVNLFGSPETRIYARRDGEPRVTAVYNYHPEGTNQRAAGFGDFRAIYPFPLSDEWQAWRAKDGVYMSPADFAAFLEDRLIDVYAVGESSEDQELLDFARAFGGTFATPAGLLSMSRSLEINANVAVKQVQRLESGEYNVAFSEEHRDGDGKPFRIANLFAIGIPIFVDGERFKIIVRLRYRLAPSGGGVMWMYSMVKPKQYLDTAIKESITVIAESTKRGVLFGEPDMTAAGVVVAGAQVPNNRK